MVQVKKNITLKQFNKRFNNYSLAQYSDGMLN
jgi:hypothetical protein